MRSLFPFFFLSSNGESATVFFDVSLILRWAKQMGIICLSMITTNINQCGFVHVHLCGCWGASFWLSIWGTFIFWQWLLLSKYSWQVNSSIYSEELMKINACRGLGSWIGKNTYNANSILWYSTSDRLIFWWNIMSL